MEFLMIIVYISVYLLNNNEKKSLFRLVQVAALPLKTTTSCAFFIVILLNLAARFGDSTCCSLDKTELLFFSGKSCSLTRPLHYYWSKQSNTCCTDPFSLPPPHMWQLGSSLFKAGGPPLVSVCDALGLEATPSAAILDAHRDCSVQWSRRSEKIPRRVEAGVEMLVHARKFSI